MISEAGALTKENKQQNNKRLIRITIWLAAEVKPHDLGDKPQLKNSAQKLGKKKKGETFQHRFGCQNNRNNPEKSEHKEKKFNEICSTFMDSKTNRCWQKDVANSSCCCSAEPNLQRCERISCSLCHPPCSRFQPLTQSSHCLCMLCALSHLLPTQWV